jgi:DNA polymerase-3 subunit delta'
MAQRLATNASARSRRAETIQLALAVASTADAVAAATRLLAIAGDDAASLTTERDDAEREAALRSLGVEPGGTVPPALRAQLKAMEEDQKRRATRSLRDGIDRILLDLLSLFRDILVTQLGATVDLVNIAVADELRRAAAQTTAAQTLATLDAITVARNRIESNVSAALALEAMMIAAIRRPR